MVRSPLTAARATFALKAGEWFRRGRLLMVSPVHGDYRRCQAEIPLIVLFRFPGPALNQRDAEFRRRYDGHKGAVFGPRETSAHPELGSNGRRCRTGLPRSTRPAVE